MYNVRILKYPTGWQYRVYSRPVGFCDNDNISETEYVTAWAWNEDIQDFVEERFNPKKKCIEPFTGTLATLMEEPRESDPERSARVSMGRTVNRVYHLARSNVWDWFITLTFDPVKVNSFSYEECTKKLKNWLDIVKRSCPQLKYIIVPEKHKSGAFHFHGLLADCSELDFAESGHFTKDGQPIYNIGKYKLGWSTATKVTDNGRVTKYISKYITKELCAVSFGKKRYWASRNLVECPVEEFLLEGSELSHVLEALKSKSSYIKVVEGMELKTTYIEMGVQNE